MPENASKPPVRPLSDRRYLPRGPLIPYRGGELLLLLMDLFVIFFGIKVVETIYASSKGNALIQTEKEVQAAARREEEEMLATRTAKRDSLKAVEEDVVSARHADSLRIADLDTLFNQVTGEIAEVAVEIQERSGEVQKAMFEVKKADKKLKELEKSVETARTNAEKTQGEVADLGPGIAAAHAEIRDAEAALAVTLSKRPEVVVPATSSASVATHVSKGDLFSSVGLGRSFVNFGRAQLGLTANAGFGPDRTTVSGGGLFLNVPLIPNRASVDISSGASFLTEGSGRSDTSPFLAGTLRYAVRPGKRLYIVGDGRVSHERVWTGIGIGIGRR